MASLPGIQKNIYISLRKEIEILSGKSKKTTPLMQQYNTIKNRYPDALLLFRVGDFYETFGQDAVKAAKILNIVLTNRNNGSERTELAGFPHHSLNTYLPKLVKAGERVAICDQLEDPKMTKTIVKRGVTELITPGVAMNDEVLQSRSNNFLGAVHFGKKCLGISFLDVSTGEYLTAEGQPDYIDKLLQNFAPSEILVPKNKKKEFAQTFGEGYNLFLVEDWVFKIDHAYESLNKHFGTTSLKGFGVDQLEDGLIAAGAILYYLSETQHHRVQHISRISRVTQEEYMWMDRFTIRNLELYHSPAAQAVTLLDIIDRTISPMGSRMLKRWLALPLRNIDRIKDRHKVVSYLVENPLTLRDLQQHFREISDLERLISKIATGKANPREVTQLSNSLKAIWPVRSAIMESKEPALQKIGEALDNCEGIVSKITSTLNEEAPVNINKGKCIADGFSAELDELRQMAFSGKTYLDELLERECAATGITSLKIANNNVFGYYIEVRNTHKERVPEHWTRKQTLVNAERYITPELKEYEAKILGAEEKIQELEQQIFAQLVEWLGEFIVPVQKNAALIARLDCLCSFADQAVTANYCKPEINDSHELKITKGRHPVIEKRLPLGEPYISNDIHLDREHQQIMMITGPNMSGKSAILRQTALIVILAQMGSFVPAEAAEFGVVDKIFTRVGASDNISMGESTFMVEMNETANILNNLSDRSLVLLDEIGRGTSTYDGISIAWAITEYLHEHPSRAKTLFATHYHELNDMTNSFGRIRNYNVSVKELKEKVLFLRKLVPGGSEHSFGIHVARMAGMPQQVLHRANKILKKLESSHGLEDKEVSLSRVAEDHVQLSFFNLDDPILEELREEILHLDIDTLTPVEALMKLNEIKRTLGVRKQASV